MENEGKKTIANIFFLISILSPIGLTSILYLDFEQEIVVPKTKKTLGTTTTGKFFKKTLILAFGANVKYSALSCQITFFLCFRLVYTSPKKLPHHEGQSGGWLTYFFGKKQRTSVSLSFPIRIFFTIPAPPTPLLNDNGKCWSRFALFLSGSREKC